MRMSSTNRASGRTLSVVLISFGLWLTGLAAASAPAGAAALDRAKIDLHPNHNTLGNLSELGILSRPVAPADFAGVDWRFPLDFGDVEFGRHARGDMLAKGGFSFFDESGRNVTFRYPSIDLMGGIADLWMKAGGTWWKVAHLPEYELTRERRRFEVKRLARFASHGAGLITERLDTTYPHRKTLLGVLHIEARLVR